MRILLGSVAMVDDGEQPGITSPDYVVFLPKPGVLHHRWLYYWLRSADGAALIKSLTRGAVRERLLFRRLAAGEIDPPAYQAQLRFAEAVQHVARARAAAEARLEAASGLMDGYLRSIFESEEKRGWPKKRIADFAETSSGSTPSRSRLDYYGGTIPWVKTGELIDDVVLDTEEHVTSKAIEECGLKVLPAGTCLVAMYGQGQTRGRTGILGVPATTNQACFAVQPNAAQFEPRFLQGWFRYSYRRLRSQTEGRGGNQPNLNGDLLRNEEVVLPPVSVQITSAATIAEHERDVRSLEASLREELRGVTALPAALLRRAFRGEL